MRGKGRSYRKAHFAQVQHAGARLPLVELGHHFFPALEIVVPETLDYAACNNAEHRALLVIPVAGDGIHAVIPPEGGQHIVGLGQELLVVYQDGEGLPGDVPPAHTEPDALSQGLRLPGTVQQRIFQEIRIVAAVHPYVGADENMPPAQLRL